MGSGKPSSARQLANAPRPRAGNRGGSGSRVEASPGPLASPQWDSESLWQKARYYAQAAHQLTPGDSRVAFLSALSLEFLMRAAVARVHPALLAHPNDDGVSLLYCFGVSAGKDRRPRSVETKTVIARLGKILPEFSGIHSRICEKLSEPRNEELHTGSRPFDDLPESEWLGDYYTAVAELARFIGKPLKELLGIQEAKAAQRYMRDFKGAVRKGVESEMAASRKRLNSLSKSEQAARRSVAEKTTLLQLKISAGKGLRHGITTPCPVCKAPAYLAGSSISESDPQFDGGTFVINRTYLSTHLRCSTCELMLDGPSAISFAKAPTRFIVPEPFDFSELFDPGEDLYMNM